MEIAALPACWFLVFHLVPNNVGSVSNHKVQFEVGDLLMVNLPHESALLLRSQNYRNHLVSMIHSASCCDWFYLSGNPRAVFPIPVDVLAFHHPAFGLFACFVSVHFALRPRFVT